ncbi:MAG: phenylalanine--tRNA ligase subunit beta-related protein, partial [Flavisolibacter sp.]
IEQNYKAEILKEKTSNILTGLGFSEILTNSITNSAHFSDEELKTAVRLLNNLSNELNIMRPSMLHTALEVIAFNLNRKNNNLRFFEFGKTYSTTGVGKYNESNHLCLYFTGQLNENQWKEKAKPSDIYYIKGVAEALLANLGITHDGFEIINTNELESGLSIHVNGEKILELGRVNSRLASKFDIKQPVFFADFYWDAILKYAGRQVQFEEISKYPSVERDLAMVVPKSMKYKEISERIDKLRLNKLKGIKLFDVFESEKLGKDKKSLAVNFTFLDEEKTLTDKEIDSWMNKIMTTLEKELNAEIRK